MNNYDPWHMLENVSEKELQEFCNKQASKSGQHHQRPLREGFVFLISYFEAIEHIPRRLQFRALKVLLDYAFYGELPPENTPSRIMQSFVGWKRLLDADAKKYDRRKKDRFASKPLTGNEQEPKPQNNKNKVRNKQKAGKK